MYIYIYIYIYVCVCKNPYTANSDLSLFYIHARPRPCACVYMCVCECVFARASCQLHKLSIIKHLPCRTSPRCRLRPGTVRTRTRSIRWVYSIDRYRSRNSIDKATNWKLRSLHWKQNKHYSLTYSYSLLFQTVRIKRNWHWHVTCINRKIYQLSCRSLRQQIYSSWLRDLNACYSVPSLKLIK